MVGEEWEDAFGEFTNAFRKNTKKTLKEMAQLVKTEVKRNTRVADAHTPTWLKKMKHPYSGNQGAIPHKEPLVHRVSGNLTDSVKIFNTDKKGEMTVGVEEADVPYVGWIVNGSEKMIARDFLSYSLANVKRRLSKMVQKNYKKTVKKAGKKVGKKTR